MRGLMPFRRDMRPQRKKEAGWMDFLEEMLETGLEEHQMRTDIKEKEYAYLMEMELPGYDKDDIQIEVGEDILTVTAKKEAETEKKDGGYLRKERKMGTVQRSFSLDENVDREGIKARFKNGVLNVELPKKEKEKRDGRIIDID